MVSGNDAERCPDCGPSEIKVNHGRYDHIV